MEKKTKEGVAYKCPQCGSIDITIISDELGKCNNCNASVVLPKNQKKIVVKNEFHVETKTDKNVTYTAVKKEFNEVDFLRKAYLTISANASTPEDVLSSKFSKVQSTHENYLILDGDANINFTATIGYDRKEEYTEYNSSTGKFDKKTRTVTDWQAYSGAYSGNYVRAVKNANEIKDDYSNSFVLHIK